MIISNSALLDTNILKIYPKEGILEIIIDLLKRYKVDQRDIFDLQLVATMLSNNVTHLYTYNQNDFIKFSEIKVLSPSDFFSKKS